MCYPLQKKPRACRLLLVLIGLVVVLLQASEANCRAVMRRNFGPGISPVNLSEYSYHAQHGANGSNGGRTEDGMDGAMGDHGAMLLLYGEALTISGSLSLPGGNGGMGGGGGYGLYEDSRSGNGGKGGNGGRGGICRIKAGAVFTGAIPDCDGPCQVCALSSVDLSGGSGGMGGEGGELELRCDDLASVGRGGKGGNGAPAGSIRIFACGVACLRIASKGGNGGDGGTGGVHWFDNATGAYGPNQGMGGDGGNGYGCSDYGVGFEGRAGLGGFAYSGPHACSSNGQWVYGTVGKSGTVIGNCPDNMLGMDCTPSEPGIFWPPPYNTGWIDVPGPIFDPPTGPVPNPGPGEPPPAPTPEPDPTPPTIPPAPPTLPCGNNLPGDSIATAETLTCNTVIDGSFISNAATVFCTPIAVPGQTSVEAQYSDRAWTFTPPFGTPVTIVGYSAESPFLLSVGNSANPSSMGLVRGLPGQSRSISFTANGSTYVIVLKAWLFAADFKLQAICNGTGDPCVGVQDYWVEAPANSANGWLPDGVDSGPSALNSPNDVDVSSANGLSIIVRPSPGRARVMGWRVPQVMSYSTVGANKFVRGKFYIHTSNPANTPVNHVPNFRLRLDNELGVSGWAQFNHASTGISGVFQDPAYPNYHSNFPIYDQISNNPTCEVKVGETVRPSSNPNQPSLYIIDFDPVDVPAASNSNIAATFQSETYHAAADGMLTLSECTVGTYPKLADTDGTLLFRYDSATGLSGGIGGPKVFWPGRYNLENDARFGRRQAIFLGSPYDSVPASQFATVTSDSNGITIDSLNVASDRFGSAFFTITSNNLADRPRVGLNKLYKARFYAVSDIPAVNTAARRQANVKFRLTTGGGARHHYLEFFAPYQNNDATGSNKSIAIGSQGIPSSGSQNPDRNYSLETSTWKGGWYTVLMSSPLNPAVRADGGSLSPFLNEPGPGVNQESMRDISMLVEVLQQPTLIRVDLNPSAPLWTWMPQNRGRVRIKRIELYEYPDLCGYNQ